MDAALVRLLQKIEASEALTDAELAELLACARADPGRMLRTAVAQALLERDAVAEAMTVLDGLERDFPHDGQVAMARARAFVSQERYAEAEPALQRALKINPGDPEVKKALAAVAMRRAEFARARALLNEVLAVDPFDSEAQQLIAELDAPPESATRPIPLLEDFTARLLRQLKSQSTPHLLQKEQLLVRLGKGGVARLDLKSLYRSFLDGSASLEGSVEALARELAERSLGLPEGRSPLLSQVLPLLRDSAFLDRAVGAAHREGPAGLLVFYALKDSDLVRYVPSGAMVSHGVSLEELDEAAWKNLNHEATLPRPLELLGGALRLSNEPTGLWTLARGDGHDAARLLCRTQQAQLLAKVGPGRLRLYLGLRELVMLCRDDDPHNVAKLSGLEAAAEGIAGAFTLEAGRITRLDDWK